MQKTTNGIAEDTTAIKYFDELADRIQALTTELEQALPDTVVKRLRDTVTYLQSSKSKRLQPQERKFITRK